MDFFCFSLFFGGFCFVGISIGNCLETFHNDKNRGSNFRKIYQKIVVVTPHGRSFTKDERLDNVVSSS